MRGLSNNIGVRVRQRLRGSISGIPHPLQTKPPAGRASSHEGSISNTHELLAWLDALPAGDIVLQSCLVFA